MATEYKLSYMASEIDEKLGKIDGLESAINNINVSSEVIIDVTELPTENIKENVFYRLLNAKFVSNSYVHVDTWKCYIVDLLPEIGVPVTTDMVNITAYYNTKDKEVYGYVDSMVSAAGGVPIGWYPIGVLGQAFDIAWGGIITDADNTDASAKILLSQDYYLYQDGWCKLAIGYEKVPEFDIRWDGVIGDKFALDLTSLGFPNAWFVKISDEVFTVEQLIGATYTQSDGYIHPIDENSINSDTYPGALNIDNIVVCYESDDTNAALGLPSGYLTNGIYFVYYNDGEEREYWTDRLVAPSKVVKIDEKFLPEMSVESLGLHSVAKSGNYRDLYNQPMALCYDARYGISSQYQKNVRDTINVYSKSEVDTKIANSGSSVDLSGYAKTTDVETMITNAIGNAIGGEY